MRNCEQCGNEIPEREDACPHCGAACPRARIRDYPHELSMLQDSSDEDLPSEEAPTRPPRRFTWTMTLIVLNVIAYIVEVVVGGSLKPEIPALLRLGANYGPYTMEGEWWRLFAAMFLHGDALHILFNMWALLNVGMLAEAVFGRRNFLFLYLLCGLGGNIGSLWWHPVVVGVGASGAIFGVAGALLPAIYFERNQQMRAALKSSLVSIAIFVVFNLAWGAKSATIDNAAHLGGLITGVLLGALIPTVGHADFWRKQNRALAVFAITLVLLTTASAYAKRFHFGTIHYVRALDLFKDGNRQEAIREARLAISRDPTLADAHYLLANLLEMEKRHAEAIPELEEMVRLRPSFADAHSQLCATYLRVNRVEEAKASCKRAVALTPTSPDYQFNLGLVYRIDHETANAVQAFAAAKKLAPASAENGYFYALALEEDGQDAAARQAFEQVVAEHPEYKPAQTKLSSMRRK